MRIGLASVLGLAGVLATFAGGERSPAFGASRGAPLALEQRDDERPRPRAERVIVVTLDGTRWQEIFGGTDAALEPDAPHREPAELVPTLHRWATRDGAALGVPGHAATMSVTGPHFVSLPGYTELFGGATPKCADNDCPPTRERTLVDALGQDAVVLASWERVEHAAAAERSGAVISAGRTRVHGGARLRADARTAALLEEGAAAAPWPGGGEYRPDAHTAALALRVSEVLRPRFLFVALGDTDEHAHHGDYAAYLGALRAADRFLGDLERDLEQLGDAKRTAIFVTTDHGRSAGFRDHGGAWPESARTWLVAKGAGIAARGALAAPVRRRLADVAPTVRALLGLPLPQGAGAGAPMDELFAH
jgi:hypothetical protein